MSFRQWLYDALVDEGVIDEESMSIDEMSENTLFSETVLDSESLQQYKNEFEEHCHLSNLEPVWDLD